MNNSKSNERTISSAPSRPKYSRQEVRERQRILKKNLKAGALALGATVSLIGAGVIAQKDNSGPNSSQETAALDSVNGIGSNLKLSKGVNVRETPNTINTPEYGGGPSNIIMTTTKAINVKEPLTSTKYPGWEAFVLPGDNTASAKTVGWVNVNELELQGYAQTQEVLGSGSAAHVNSNGTISVAKNHSDTPVVDPNAGLSYYASH